MGVVSPGEGDSSQQGGVQGDAQADIGEVVFVVELRRRRHVEMVS